MSVQIRELTVRDLGPLRKLDIELGAFNLIYGKNERGKTFLVEFLLRSLFKSLSKWGLRHSSAAGKVLVAGLEEEAVSFSPSTSIKLEDYLVEMHEGMPLNLDKLLVVKGAELSMVGDEPGGINRAILKEYLSSEAVLDAIQKNISTTLRDTSIENGGIQGSNRGEIKTYRGLKNDLTRIDGLFKQIDETYSEGHRASLHKRLEEIQGSVDQQKKAKRHQASVLDKNMRGLGEQKGELSVEALNELREKHHDYRVTLDSIEGSKQQIKDLKEKSENYLWLKQAIDEYERGMSGGEIRERRQFAVLGSIAYLATAIILIGMGFGFLNYGVGAGAALISLITGVVFTVLYNRDKNKLFESAFDTHEIQQISEEFKSRFSKKLTSLAAMRAILDELQPDYYKQQDLADQVYKGEAVIGSYEVALKEMFSRLGEKPVGKEEWPETISGLDRRLKEIDSKIQETREALSRLDVDASDYIEDDQGVKYQKSVLDKLELYTLEIRGELKDEEHKLETLKQLICLETSDEISIAWERLIDNLRSRRAEVSEEFRKNTAAILAKVLINQQLEEIRRQEDVKIQDSLNSKVVTDPLKQITGHYEKLSLKDDQIIISDKYNDFPLVELSTGAQEQVLLALRIGCASKILGKDSLFLILDDAFQYADWDRRGWLLEEVINLAQRGWQIIYLTMDDHLRDLFHKRGSKDFKKGYRFINLETIT